MAAQRKQRPGAWIGLFVALGLILAIGAIVVFGRGGGDMAARERPVIGLVTSLPLVWGEGDPKAILAGQSEPAAIYRKLEERYVVRPMDQLTRIGDVHPDIILLAQPAALTPADLVALDNWIRRGGKVMILADPALQWESSLPLGDRRRPLFTSMLSPLFDHWGVELVLPMDDPRAQTQYSIDGFSVLTAVPGEFRLLDGKGDVRTRCTLAARGLTIDCRIADGRVIAVADADWLDARLWEEQGLADRLFGGPSDNVDFLFDRLAALTAPPAN